MSYGVITGNVMSMGVVQITASPAAVTANTTLARNLTVPGIKPTDIIVSVGKQTHQAGLGVVGWRVISDNTVGITMSNNTGNSITPTAGDTYTVVWIRPGAVYPSVTN